MDTPSIYKTIRETVTDNIPGAHVLLFGSRARGEEDRFSDYDLMIITQQTFNPKEKVRLMTLLDRAIVNAIEAPVDILLNSEEEILEKQDLPGPIVRTAMRKGIIL